MCNTAVNQFKSLFLLDPDIVFLNHGSFGACPKEVFKKYQDLQKKLERQPVLFLGREYAKYDEISRMALGKYLSAEPSDIAIIPNVTYGVNLIARSLSLKPGDEVLTTNHEYGACEYVWEYICQKTGAKLIKQDIPFPPNSKEEMTSCLWAGVSSKTKVIFISHITSPTALEFPVRDICDKARKNEILTIIDGAHAPGQIPLNLTEIDADIYIGNCHKWMLSPKGAGFLYVRRDIQDEIIPLVISWGFHTENYTTTGSRFIDYLQWSGTHDPSAGFSIPYAIEFMEKYQWQQVAMRCNNMLKQVISRIHSHIAYPAQFSTNHINSNQQMAVVELPQSTDINKLKMDLYDHYKIEIPLILWNDRKLLRISIQAYNSQQDADCLVDAINELIPH